ncbi:MAG TPA: hypothetical protein VHP14_03250, partial [Anaerolineales bacterium]|nr:hypothetical protein [Anaerolineales bacterium]
LERGHYFGVPSVFARILTGRWIIARTPLEFVADKTICEQVRFAGAGRERDFYFLYCEEKVDRETRRQVHK